MQIIKHVFLTAISISTFYACQKKVNETEVCPTFNFTNEIVYDINANGHAISQLQEQENGSFYAVLGSGYLNKNQSFAQLDADFNVLTEYSFDNKKIVDYIELPDGRFLISSPHETGQLSILSNDLDSLERLDTDFDTYPYFEQLEDGILMSIGSDVYSTKIIKLNYALEEEWIVNIGTAKTYAQYYNSADKILCLPTGYSQVQLIDVTAGKLIRTLDHGNLINSVIYDNDHIYSTGTYGPKSTCEKNVFVQKMDSYGNVIWNTTYGTTDADDDGISLHLEGKKLYVASIYRELCSPHYFNGYHNFHFAQLNEKGIVERCYLETDYDQSRPGSFFKKRNGKLFVSGGYNNNGVDKLIFRGLN